MMSKNAMSAPQTIVNGPSAGSKQVSEPVSGLKERRARGRPKASTLAKRAIKSGEEIVDASSKPSLAS